MERDFYVYIYFDPRKFGSYSYDLDMSFIYEPFYVGKGTKFRLNSHLNKVKGGSNNIFNKFNSAKIKKIINEDIEPFIFVYRDKLSEKEAFFLESELIKKIGRKDLKKGPLTNFTNGGEGSSGRKLSEETKEKIRQKAIGRKHSEESKKKMSEKRKGDKNSNFGKTGEKSHWFGKKHSEDSIKKMKKKKPEGFGSHLLGKSMLEDTKKKIGESNKGKRAIPINIFDINGMLLKECRTTTEASNFSGLKSSEIKKFIKNGQPSKRGFILKYKEK